MLDIFQTVTNIIITSAGKALTISELLQKLGYTQN